MFSFLRKPKPGNSAETAKDRLQILLSQERSDRSKPDIIPQLQRDILEVVRRYLRVSEEGVDVKVERGDDSSTLEINIELPEGAAFKIQGAA